MKFSWLMKMIQTQSKSPAIPISESLVEVNEFCDMMTKPSVASGAAARECFGESLMFGMTETKQVML